MVKVVLCTSNPGKIAELNALLPRGIQVVGLKEAGMPMDLPETGSDCRVNALQKARYVHKRSGAVCIADDSGLEVDALGGEPGVHSARYAGPEKDAAANMRLLLDRMEGRPERTARFRTVIAWVSADQERTFEGVLEGTITSMPKGTKGFGYDPVFVPVGSARTFAEMTAAEKNAISHRAIAMIKLREFVEREGGTVRHLQ